MQGHSYKSEEGFVFPPAALLLHQSHKGVTKPDGFLPQLLLAGL